MFSQPFPDTAAKSGILKRLTGGDLRSDGKANYVAELVIRRPEFLPDLIEGFASDSKLIRMRTSHAVEVISRINGHLLTGYKPRLIECIKNDPPAGSKMALSPGLWQHFALRSGSQNNTARSF